MVKRILPCLMAIVIVFCSVIRPVYATEVVNNQVEDLVSTLEEVDYYVNFVGDSYTYVDENGYILEITPNDVQTYSAAAGLLTLSSTGGAMGAGTASILAAAAPVLAYVLAAGVVVYSVVGLAQYVMDMYYKLSPDAKAELAEIVNSGAESFSLTATLANELSVAFDEVFYLDDGTFNSSGITFDASNMLQYDRESQYVHGNELTSMAYHYRLSSSPVAINGTTLAMSVVASPFENGMSAKALKYTNTATGASLTFSTNSTFLERDCCSYHFTAPTVETLSQSDGYVYHQMGVWILRICSNLVAGKTCENCVYTYTSEHFSEAFSASKRFYTLFENTNIPLLDGVIFESQHLRGVQDIELYRETAINGETKVSLPYSAMEVIMSAMSFSIGSTAVGGSITIPEEDDRVYIPPAGALGDANKLTQTGANTGTWEESLTDTNTGTGTGTGTGVDTTSWWQELLNWLRSFWTSLTNTLSNVFAPVITWVQAFWDTFTGAITAVLEAVFVPDLTAFSELVDVYTSKFGWVTDIYNYLVQVVNRLTWNTPPKIPINLSAAESKYNWGGSGYALDMTWYSRYKDSVDTIISGICWVYFAWRLFRRLPDILSGVGAIEENSTLERGYILKERSERAERRSKGK